MARKVKKKLIHGQLHFIKITLKAISPHAKVLSRFVLKRLRNHAVAE